MNKYAVAFLFAFCANTVAMNDTEVVSTEATAEVEIGTVVDADGSVVKIKKNLTTGAQEIVTEETAIGTQEK